MNEYRTVSDFCLFTHLSWKKLRLTVEIDLIFLILQTSVKCNDKCLHADIKDSISGSMYVAGDLWWSLFPCCSGVRSWLIWSGRTDSRSDAVNISPSSSLCRGPWWSCWANWTLTSLTSSPPWLPGEENSNQITEAPSSSDVVRRNLRAWYGDNCRRWRLGVTDS